jgi:Tol biopolymer transport system component
MNSDGSNLQVLSDGKYPQFSPDGSKIAYIGTNKDQNEDEVMIINSDGTSIKQLTSNERVNDFPQFSPDGKQIAFKSYDSQISYIYVMDIQGKNLRVIGNTGLYNDHVRFQPVNN